MSDVIVLALILAFFALCVAYVTLCDRIIGPDPEPSPTPSGADSDGPAGATATQASSGAATPRSIGTVQP